MVPRANSPLNLSPLAHHTRLQSLPNIPVKYAHWQQPISEHQENRYVPLRANVVNTNKSPASVLDHRSETVTTRNNQSSLTKRSTKLTATTERVSAPHPWFTPSMIQRHSNSLPHAKNPHAYRKTPTNVQIVSEDQKQSNINSESPLKLPATLPTREQGLSFPRLQPKFNSKAERNSNQTLRTPAEGTTLSHYHHLNPHCACSSGKPNNPQAVLAYIGAPSEEPSRPVLSPTSFNIGGDKTNCASPDSARKTYKQCYTKPPQNKKDKITRKSISNVLASDAMEKHPSTTMPQTSIPSCSNATAAKTTLKKMDNLLKDILKANPCSFSYQPDSTVLRDWRIVSLLGSGTFASVYKVQHRTTNMLAAAKLLAPYRFSEATQPRIIEMFAKEIRYLVECQCPGVVGIHQIIRGYEGWFIVEELVTGGTLWEDATSKSKVEEFLLFVQLLQTVMRFQENGVVHRDLKPTNILRRKNTCRLYVTDFGWSEVATNLNAHTHELPGTIEINPPEVLLHQSNQCKKIDNYALAMNLMLLLSRKFVCRDDKLTTDEAARRMLSGVALIRTGCPLPGFTAESWDVFLGLSEFSARRRYSLIQVVQSPWCIKMICRMLHYHDSLPAWDAGASSGRGTNQVYCYLWHDTLKTLAKRLESYILISPQVYHLPCTVNTLEKLPKPDNKNLYLYYTNAASSEQQQQSSSNTTRFAEAHTAKANGAHNQSTSSQDGFNTLSESLHSDRVSDCNSSFFNACRSDANSNNMKITLFKSSSSTLETPSQRISKHRVHGSHQKRVCFTDTPSQQKGLALEDVARNQHRRCSLRNSLNALSHQLKSPTTLAAASVHEDALCFNAREATKQNVFPIPTNSHSRSAPKLETNKTTPSTIPPKLTDSVDNTASSTTAASLCSGSSTFKREKTATHDGLTAEALPGSGNSSASLRSMTSEGDHSISNFDGSDEVGFQSEKRTELCSRHDDFTQKTTDRHHPPNHSCRHGTSAFTDNLWNLFQAQTQKSFMYDPADYSYLDPATFIAKSYQSIQDARQRGS